MKSRPYYIKVGKVTEIKADNCSVKVSFLEHDNIVSYYLPVLQSFAGANASYMLPNIDDDVVCVVDHFGVGFCLGAIYNSKHKPKVDTENKYSITFDDDTSIEYDREEHKLLIDIKGDSQIIIDKTLNIEITEDSTIQTKNINITVDKEVNIECEKAIVKANDKVEINGSTVSLCSATSAEGVVAVGSPCPLTGSHSKGSSKVFAPGI